MTAQIIQLEEYLPQPEAVIATEPLTAYLASLHNPLTARARAGDAADLGQEGQVALLAGGPPANKAVEDWVGRMRRRGLHPRTINRRISFARDFVAWARRHGLCEHAVDVKNVRCPKQKNRTGPGEEPVRRLLMALTARSGSTRGRRDLALFGLLYGQALRVSEVTGLEVGDVAGGVAMVRRKGHTDVRQPVPLAAEVREWCKAWDGLVTWRSGPWLGRVSSEGSVTPGLTPDGVRHILKGWAAEIGVDKLRPHGLRHTHATLVLTHAGAATARCSLGHTSPATIQHYDDDEGRRIVEGASVAIKSIQESQPCR